jgi:tRNA(Glu) U13 pseudouridine synthase TruD
MMPTWPVVWYNLLLAPKDSVSWNKEKSFLDLNWISEKSLRVCKQYKIFWIRRPLWVFPEKVSVKFQDDDILLHFTLPSWSYASIMINELEKTVWVKVYY